MSPLAYCLIFDSGYATTDVNHTEKIVNEIDNWDQFHKPFLALFTPHWHIALRFDSSYAAMSVNNAEKHFMKLILVAIFIKLFWCNYLRNGILP